jgi:hypothetical protein
MPAKARQLASGELGAVLAVLAVRRPNVLAAAILVLEAIARALDAVRPTRCPPAPTWWPSSIGSCADSRRSSAPCLWSPSRLGNRRRFGEHRAMTTQELRAALIAAFPPAPLTAELIHAPDASWTSYEEFAALAQLEGQLWTELAPEVHERHSALLVHAGSALYRATCRRT